MSWSYESISDRSGLMPPADSATIDNALSRLGTRLPQDYLDFLQFADGGILPGGTVIVYSAGTGAHPQETLLAANQNRPADFPLLLVARDAYEEFGFLKSDLARLADTGGICPLYRYWHETESLEKVADSFADFVRRVVSSKGDNSADRR